jgi:hypothetical protein
MLLFGVVAVLREIYIKDHNDPVQISMAFVSPYTYRILHYDRVSYS